MKEGEGIWKEGREKRIGEKDGNRDWSKGQECGLERRKKRKEFTEKDGQEDWREGRERDWREGRQKGLVRSKGIGIEEKEKKLKRRTRKSY